MALQLPAYVTVNPSFQEPELLLQYNQASGFVDALAGSQLRARLGEDDLYVYMRQVNVRTKIAAGQSTYNELPGIDIAAKQLSTPSYMLRARADYDHHDVRAGANWGFSTVEAYRLGLRQAHFQFARDAALFGMNPQNGEGLVNATNALAINLPPDQNGVDTVTGYDNGEMAFFLSEEAGAIKQRTLQLGIGRDFTIIGPQRTMVQFEYNVVQLTQFQREGAGTSSTAGTVKHILMQNGDSVIWAYDDTLQGAGGSPNDDLVLIVMPEVAKPAGDKPVNTNEFAKLGPGNPVCTTQYCDMAAPREIISPLAGGRTDMLTEWRITSGWPVRGEAITIITMPYQ
jgi:hypothetical protein